MQTVDGVSGVSRSVTWVSILAGGDEIDASRFRSGNTVRGCGLDGFLLFKHLSKVIGRLASNRLIRYTSMYRVASPTLASHGAAQ